MKKIILSISLLFLFNSLNGQIMKTTSSSILADKTFHFTTSSILADVSIHFTTSSILADVMLFISTHDVYNELIKEKPKSIIKMINITSSSIFADKSIHFTTSSILADKSVYITNNINQADMVIFISERDIDNFSGFPMYETISKKYYSQSGGTHEELLITKIENDGEIIHLSNGSVYRTYQSYMTSLWMEFSWVTVINDKQMINEFWDSDKIDVVKIK